MANQENAWLVDMLVEMVSSPSWNERIDAIDAFVVQKRMELDLLLESCKLEFMQEWYAECALLVKGLVEVDMTTEDFKNQVMESCLKDDEGMQRVVLLLSAAEDFLEFQNMMQATEEHGGMTAEEERLAIAVDATMEEQQAAAASHAAPTPVPASPPDPQDTGPFVAADGLRIVTNFFASGGFQQFATCLHLATQCDETHMGIHILCVNKMQPTNPNEHTLGGTLLVTHSW
eukprot:Skav214871  [mRNA]  locus=scaffold3187:25791:26483:+ [translate_table: standard]